MARAIICRLAYKSTRNGVRYYRLTVCVTSTDKAVLDWMHAVTGIGAVISTGHQVGRRKPCWRWQVNGRPAKLLLEILMPYLRIKQEKAEKALAGQTFARVHDIV